MQQSLKLAGFKLGDAPLARTSSLKIMPFRFRMCLFASDAFALLLSAVAAYYTISLVQHYLFGIPPYTMQHAIFGRSEIYLALSLGVLLTFANKGLYSTRMPWLTQVHTIGKILFIIFLIDGFFSFAMKMQASRLLLSLTWLFAFGLIVVMRYVIYAVITRADNWKIPTVILADNNTAEDLIYAFYNDPCAGYDVHTAFLRDPDFAKFEVSSLPRSCRRIKLYNGLQDCQSYILNNPNNFYVLAMDAFRGEVRDGLIEALDATQAHYALVPSLAQAGFHHVEPHYYFGHDILILHADLVGKRFFSPGRIAKRTIDILVSGLALVVLSPVFIGIAAMLKVEGQGGSIFYGGKRVGKNGKLFRCWKFRSMEPDSDHLLYEYLEANPIMKARWEKYRKLPKDPRITTRTAALIRKLSLDELPQLWNVFKGDMSIVGPRPILTEEQHYFGRRLKQYLSVRPGLTGLWQVSGRNATSFMRRVYWDSWYVRNWSLWHDIIIMLKTPVVLVSGKGAS